jgi:hypothetical protein
MGFGRPYSTSQLETQLRLHGFLPQKASAALFQIPSNRRSWQKMGPFLERIGNRLPRLAGGVLMLEVSTRKPPLPGLKTPVLRARPLRVLEGLRAADPKPALERAKERC